MSFSTIKNYPGHDREITSCEFYDGRPVPNSMHTENHIKAIYHVSTYDNDLFVGSAIAIHPYFLLTAKHNIDNQSYIIKNATNNQSIVVHNNQRIDLPSYSDEDLTLLKVHQPLKHYNHFTCELYDFQKINPSNLIIIGFSKCFGKTQVLHSYLNAKIIEQKSIYFTHQLQANNGNSGAPIFHIQKHILSIVGIHIGGYNHIITQNLKFKNPEISNIAINIDRNLLNHIHKTIREHT